MPLSQQEVAYRRGYDFRIGVASASGSPMNVAIGGEITPPEMGGGGSGEFYFRRVLNNSELENELGIGVDVSAGIGLFSGSAAFDFARKCKIQTTSLCVVTAARRDYAFEQVDTPSLTEEAAKLVERGKLDEFNARYGDYFIRGASRGGRFLGVIRIDTKSVESRSQVDAALSLSYGLVADGDVKVRIVETLKTAEATVEAYYYHLGGTVNAQITSAEPTTALDQLYAAMREWQSSVDAAPAMFGVTLAPYAIALGPEPPNMIEFERQRSVLIRCARLRSTTQDTLYAIDYMLDPLHTGEFQITPPPEGPDLDALRASLAGDLDIIAEAASHAINNIKQACDPETYMRTIKQLPDFTLTGIPPNLPKQIAAVPPPPPPPNAMPDFSGLPAEPVVSLLSCLNMERNVDHCIAHLGGDGAVLGDRIRPLGDFFVYVFNSGATFDPNGYGGRAGLVQAQFPTPGTPVEPGTTFGIFV